VRAEESCAVGQWIGAPRNLESVSTSLVDSVCSSGDILHHFAWSYSEDNFCFLS